jgi:hypothetical protein
VNLYDVEDVDDAAIYTIQFKRVLYVMISIKDIEAYKEF